MKRDVCPGCMVHTEPQSVANDRGYGAYLRRFKCPICGKSYPYCEWRTLDASEKAAAREREREYLREWEQAHPGRRKEYYDANREEICTRNRIRYRTDIEYREKRLASGRQYAKEHADEVAEYQHRYYMEHRDEIRRRQKLWRLRKAQEQKESE